MDKQSETKSKEQHETDRRFAQLRLRRILAGARHRLLAALRRRRSPTADERLAMRQLFRGLVEAELLEVVGHRADGEVVYRRSPDVPLDEWNRAWEAHTARRLSDG